MPQCIRQIGERAKNNLFNSKVDQQINHKNSSKKLYIRFNNLVISIVTAVSNKYTPEMRRNSCRSFYFTSIKKISMDKKILRFKDCRIIQVDLKNLTCPYFKR